MLSCDSCVFNFTVVTLIKTPVLKPLFLYSMAYRVKLGGKKTLHVERRLLRHSLDVSENTTVVNDRPLAER